ncbi:MAG: pyruvate kinase [Candidatus Pacebacteria bacterium]|nr:pyruvate kinase [Candidatus Paceibacterota bacterium]MBP9867000.1 pyruvate kinase [Candidatus Paceibacterota bacterium]
MIDNKKTKIVATIGPNSMDIEMLEKLIDAGMNVSRINMSHGDHTFLEKVIGNIRSAAKNKNKEVAILLDLAGPKIRTGEYETPTITIVAGKKIILTSEKIVGNDKKIYINYEKLPQEVKKGSIIMLDDGKKKLEVEKVVGNEITCKIIVGGELKPRRGVNVPGAYLSVKSITDKDKKDLQAGLSFGVDMVALSFVRASSDVIELKTSIKKAKKHVMVISKLETQEAMDNLTEILEATDGVMVARGDLAIEVPAERVPIYQKEIIARCNYLGKPVITATQMLESMIHSPVPTRAEVSDVANAIFDGTDAVMLSEESALGEYPVESVSMMTKIALSIEGEMEASEAYDGDVEVGNVISDAVVSVADSLRAKFIVALTESGETARLISRFTKSHTVLAVTSHLDVVRELSLSSGVVPLLVPDIVGFDNAIHEIPLLLKSMKLVKKGDTVVVTAGVPFKVSGSTNMLFVLHIQ